MTEVVSREGWDARQPKVPYTRLADSEGILVHHLGDGVRRDPAATDYAALMRSTQNFHMDGRGWNDFAYGWAVGGGRIYAGRGWGWIDGADTGRGRVMHSVLWLGDSYVNEVPAEDLAAIWQVIDEHQSRYPGGMVGGHRDVNATGCPGDDLYQKITAGRPAAEPIIPPIESEEDDMAMPEIVVHRSGTHLWHDWRIRKSIPPSVDIEWLLSNGFADGRHLDADTVDHIIAVTADADVLPALLPLVGSAGQPVNVTAIVAAIAGLPEATAREVLVQLGQALPG